MKEENKHKSHAKQIAGSDSIKSDVFFKGNIKILTM